MMKATGIVRRIDDLGRVVIPKEIRRTMRIREGDPLEIFVDRDGEVILKKYSPIGELSEFASEYAEALFEAVGHPVIICDRDVVITVAGTRKEDYVERRVGPKVEEAMEERKTIVMNLDEQKSFTGTLLQHVPGDHYFTASVIAPIISQGQPIGAVIYFSRDEGVELGEVETKLAETAAGFLGKQMED